MENNIKCKKCGSFGTSANGLCKNCYSKYWYNKTRYNMNLKEFLASEKKYHLPKSKAKRYEDNYNKFKTMWEEKQFATITELAKNLKVSRETTYEYKRRYEKEQSNG